MLRRYASESGEQTVLENMKEYLLNTIQRTFEVGVEQAECLYQELLECTKRKNLVSASITVILVLMLIFGFLFGVCTFYRLPTYVLPLPADNCISN